VITPSVSVPKTDSLLLSVLLLFAGLGIGFWALFIGEKSLFNRKRPEPGYGALPGSGTPIAGIDGFMSVIGQLETGGASNPYRTCAGSTVSVSPESCPRAYGKYQILPGNWETWSRRWLGYVAKRDDVWAQEYIARRQMQAYFEDAGDWRLVAAMWHGGPGYWEWGPKTTEYTRKAAERMSLPSLSFSQLIALAKTVFGAGQ